MGRETEKFSEEPKNEKLEQAEKIIDNGSRQIGDVARNVLGEYYNGDLSKEDVVAKINEQVEAAINTTESVK